MILPAGIGQGYAVDAQLLPKNARNHAVISGTLARQTP
jgi:hypothetical protein